MENDKQRFSLKAAHSGGGAQSTAADEVIDPLTIEDASALLIRANQGHSIAGVVDPEALLTPILLDPSTAAKTAADGKAKAVPVPPIVVHGTYFAFWPAIVASGGLKPMGRNHVHFATALPQNEGNGDEDASASETAAVVRGMRRDVELLVYVDVERALREVGDKMRWWISDNGVVLTAGLVEGAETGEKEEGKVPDGKGVVPLRYFKLVTGRNPDRSGVGVLWRDGEWVADLPKGLKARVPFGKGGQSGGGFGRRGGYGRGRN